MDFGYVTPGITEPNLARDPLGTEGEMTEGPNDENPFESGQGKEVEEQATDVPNPTEGENDPFLFDDVADGFGDSFENFSLNLGDGPRF